MEMEISCAFFSLMIFINCGNNEIDVNTPAVVPINIESEKIFAMADDDGNVNKNAC